MLKAGAHDMAQVRRAIRLVVKEAKAVENVVKLTFELHNRGAAITFRPRLHLPLLC